MTIGFALIGCGEIGAVNAAAVARAAGAQLAACFDVVPDLAADVAASHGATACASVAEALEAPGVTSALICTPHDTHADLAEVALTAGRSVLLEKPLAASLHDASRIARLAAGRADVAVLLPMRSDPRFEFACRVVEAGGLGRPIGALATYLIHKPSSYFAGGYSGRTASTWRTSKRRAGGGMLMMNLFHHLDALHVLLGEPLRVHAQFSNAHHAPEVDDLAALTITYASVTATVLGAGSVVNGPGEELRLWGTEGHLTILPEAVVANIDGGSTQPEPGPDVDARVRAIERFSRCVAAGVAPDAGVGEVLVTQGLVAAAYASGEAGGPVVVRDFLGHLGWI